MSEPSRVSVRSLVGDNPPPFTTYRAFVTGMAYPVMMFLAICAPELVSREDLHGAISLGAASFNLARAVGPALGGAIVAAWGPAANFGLNAISFLGVLLVLPGDTVVHTGRGEGDDHRRRGTTPRRMDRARALTTACAGPSSSR